MMRDDLGGLRDGLEGGREDGRSTLLREVGYPTYYMYLYMNKSNICFCPLGSL